MEFIQAHWSEIAFVIVVLFVVSISFIRRKADREKNSTLQKFADEMESVFRKLTDKDAVLRQTFRNVEELKKKLEPLIEGGQVPKVGELFKKLNEGVGMEDIVRDHYINLLGEETGMKKETGEDTVFFDVPEPTE